jgi:hypothetical protein
MNVNELADELDKFSELGGDVFFGYCADMLRQQQAEINVYREALEKLARLGNGDNYGNSIGNDIAVDALRKAQEK